MNEQDLKIQQLTQEVAKWKKLAMKAADKACFECDSSEEKHCRKCQISRIREEAGKS